MRWLSQEAVRCNLGNLFISSHMPDTRPNFKVECDPPNSKACHVSCHIAHVYSARLTSRAPVDTDADFQAVPRLPARTEPLPLA